MKAEYDSQADALSIDLIDVDHWDESAAIDDTSCRVALTDGRPANVELLAPRDNLALLETAAATHSLDVQALKAAAQSALAAPDRVVELKVASAISH